MALRRLRILWGDGVLIQLGAELERSGSSRALMVCGSTVSTATRLLATIEAAAAGRIAAIHAGVHAHSPVDTLTQALDAYDAHGCDGIIGLGGGSAAVTARAVAILAGERRPIEELITKRLADGRFSSPRLQAPKPPVLLLPTTPTTALPTSGTAVTKPGAHERCALFDPKARARAILVDPSLLDTAPADLIRTAAFNSVAMAVEGLIAAPEHPLATAYLHRSLDLQLANLARLRQSREDRVQMAMASILSGEGVSLSGVGITAAISHVVGHHYGVANGDVDLAVLPHVMKFLTDRELPVSKIIARAVGRRASQNLIGDLRKAGAPISLTALGLTTSDARPIAEAAATDFAISTSPRSATVDDVESIIRNAL